MNKEFGDHRLMCERLAFNRKLLVLAHVLVGLFSAMFCLSRIDLIGYPYWRSRAGLGIIFLAAPAILPYVISAIYSWQVATHRRLGIWLFLFVLIAVSVLMGLIFSGALGIDVRGTQWLVAAAAQAGIYVWAAELLLHVV